MKIKWNDSVKTIKSGEDIVLINYRNDVVMKIDQNTHELLASLEKYEDIEKCISRWKGDYFEDTKMFRSYIEDLIQAGYILTGESDTAFQLYYKVYYTITDECNLGCPTCYLNAQKVKKGQKEINKKELSSHLQKVTNIFGPLQELIITGGEPLLYFDEIYYALKYLQAGNNKIPNITILTNGILLDDEKIKKLRGLSNNPKIQISLDSINDGVNSSLREEGHLHKINKLIDKLQETEYSNFEIVPTITKTNIKYLPQMVDYFAKRNIDFHFSLLMPVGRGNKNVDQLLPDNARLLEFINEICSEDPSNFNKLSLHQCGAGQSIFNIDASGDIYPCHLLYDEDFKMGNIDDFFIKKEVNKNFTDVVETKEECRQCKYYPLCMGGCSAARYYNEGVNPYCKFTKEYLNKLII